MKALTPEELARRCAPFFEKRGWSVPDPAWGARLATCMRERAGTLVELVDAAAFAFVEPQTEARAAAKWLVPPLPPPPRHPPPPPPVRAAPSPSPASGSGGGPARRPAPRSGRPSGAPR